jgi:hypothetical protein
MAFHAFRAFEAFAIGIMVFLAIGPKHGNYVCRYVVEYLAGPARPIKDED